jgi:hypothetical protein
MMSQRWRSWLLAMPVAVALVASSGAEPIEPPTAEQLVGLFEDVALHTDDGKVVSDILWKWDRPLVVSIQGKAPTTEIAQQIDRLVGYQLRQIAMLTGLSITYPATEKVNFLIFFSDNPVADAMGARYELLKTHFFPTGDIDAAIRKQVSPSGPSLCFGFTAGSKTGSISGAAIFVPSHKGLDAVRRCINEESVQVLGLWSDTTRASLSLFNDKLPRTDIVALTYPDMILLRTLYDDRLKPGMPRAQAIALARIIIPELLRR